MRYREDPAGRAGLLFLLAWRFRRGIRRLFGFILALLLLLWVGPVLLGVPALWPVFVFLGFAAVARFTGDRVGRAQYFARLRSVITVNRALVVVVASVSAVVGVFTAVSGVVTDGTGFWRALDLAVGVQRRFQHVLHCVAVTWPSMLPLTS